MSSKIFITPKKNQERPRFRCLIPCNAPYRRLPLRTQVLSERMRLRAVVPDHRRQDIKCPLFRSKSLRNKETRLPGRPSASWPSLDAFGRIPDALADELSMPIPRPQFSGKSCIAFSSVITVPGGARLRPPEARASRSHRQSDG